MVQPDVGELALVDRNEPFRHAVDERLDPDEAGPRVSVRFRRQMLAATEAAFEANVVGVLEERAQIRWRRAREIERERRQQRVEQRRLPGLERMSLAPAEERAGDAPWR